MLRFINNVDTSIGTSFTRGNNFICIMNVNFKKI